MVDGLLSLAFLSSIFMLGSFLDKQMRVYN